MPSVRRHLLLSVCCVLFLAAKAAPAIISQPEALKDSGPVTVDLDMEIGEGLTLLKPAEVRAHAEDYLQKAGISVVRETQEQELPSVITPEQRHFAQIRITLAIRSVSDPAGYVVNIVVSHLQSAMLHPRQIVISGLGWQEAWASVVPENSDANVAVDTMLDHILDDFIKDDALANQPAPH